MALGLEPLPVRVGRLLVEQASTVATAESCTGGLLASRLTDVAGSSRYMLGGVVAYAVSVKQAVLGVPDEALAQGVVSEAVAQALALGARRVLAADWGVGTTGYAGPSPEVAARDIGLIWVAVAGPEGRMVTRCLRFGMASRAEAKLGATDEALALLQHELLR